MRCIIALIFISMGLSCLAQVSSKTISIPVLKEDGKVDELLDSILDGKITPSVMNVAPAPIEPVIYIYLNKRGDKGHNLSFHITEKDIVYSTLRSQKTMKYLGCFQYRGKPVLVSLPDGPAKLFRTLKEKKSIDIKLPQDQKDEAMKWLEGPFWDFIYRDGRFTATWE